ncbi:hypothetical protein ACFL6M_00045 [Candidatus Eisenbacteria bacterium]|uniref:DUF2207 domain-containing protein n=1 Tax=Eiseniibacteriota bacterium TaxID=2212470 RepID=A0ABV6YIN6_UNCEI
MKRFRPILCILPVLLSLLAIGCLTQQAFAQDYLFIVPDLKMQAFINDDGRVRLEYEIVFTNYKYGRAIDVIDIGLPHKDYSPQTMTARLDEHRISDIRPSTFVDPGVEIHLHSHAIDPGGSGTFRFVCTMDGLLFGDTTRDDFASFRITPTWFDKRYVLGTTTIQIAVHLPSWVTADQVRQHRRMPYHKLAKYQGHMVAYWDISDELTGPHLVGLSFRHNEMPGVLQLSWIDIVTRWLEDRVAIRIIFALIALMLFAVFYWRLTGGTGYTLGGILIIALGVATYFSSRVEVYAILVLIPVMVAIEIFLRRPKTQYLPAVAEMEGGGVKRGLTPVEVAILMEKPLHRVLGLVLFGMLRKGIIVLESNKPLRVRIHKAFLEKGKLISNRKKTRSKIARSLGTTIQGYEHGFLEQIAADESACVADVDFSKPMTVLVLQTVRRVRGCGFTETLAHYQGVVDRKFDEVSKIIDLDKLSECLDSDVEWILLHKERNSVLLRDKEWYYILCLYAVRQGQRLWHKSGLGVQPLPMLSQGEGPSEMGSTLADIKETFSGWGRNTLQSVLDVVSPGSIKLTGDHGGFIDLSGIDHVTSDVFHAINSMGPTSGGHGGGTHGAGGGCACACAGCACACACAGGGR